MNDLKGQVDHTIEYLSNGEVASPQTRALIPNTERILNKGKTV